MIAVTSAQTPLVFITGASSGIGQALAARYYAAGYCLAPPSPAGCHKTNRPYVYDGDLVEGREADDALGEEQWKSGKTTCLVGIDKDLDMIPGFHYNSKTHRVYYVNLQEANLNFLRQMLEGDRTDNIPGIRGIGKAKKFKHIPKGMHPNDACRVVAKFYHSQFKEDCYAAVREIATLLWIQRGGDADKQLDEFVRRIHEGFPAPF